MKLPDYTKSKKWVELRELMGAKDLVNFNAKIKKTSFSKPVFQKQGIQLTKKKDLDEIINKVDGTLEDQNSGRKLAVYIKEWRGSFNGRPNDKPKFHLTNCQTLVQMRAAKRFDLRYVKTDRMDGLFSVIDTLKSPKVEKEYKLRICIYCLRKLPVKYQALNLTERQSAQKFSITEYFNDNNNMESSLLRKLPSTYSKDYIPKPRPKNISRISTSYREKMNWTCEICNTRYKTNKRGLHTHHKDGDPSNNNESNLIALCKKCHDQQPGHAKWSMSKVKYVPAQKKVKKPLRINVQSLKNKYERKNISTFDAIKRGEGQQVEFKRSLLAGNKKKSIFAKSMVFNIFKSIVAFLNSDGGKLIIGVDDNGNVKGIPEIGNQFNSYDDLDLYFGNIFNKYLPGDLRDSVKWKKETIEKKDIFVIDVEKYTHKPVEITLTKHETHIVNGKKFKLTLPEEGADMEVLIRSGAQKTSLRSATAELNFIRKRFPKYYKFMIA
tara:strand:+ start:3106 stop:4587 length:1482 start_codon:yes stop_codon:yes gene_type:complete